MKVVVFVVCSIIILSMCMQEEEFGERNWKHSYLGTILQTEFPTSPHLRKTFFALSHHGTILSKVNIRTGRIEFKKTFSTPADYFRISPCETELYVFSNNGEKFETFLTKTGVKKFDFFSEEEGIPVKDLLILDDGSVVLVGNSLMKMNKKRKSVTHKNNLDSTSKSDILVEYSFFTPTTGSKTLHKKSQEARLIGISYDEEGSDKLVMRTVNLDDLKTVTGETENLPIPLQKKQNLRIKELSGGIIEIADSDRSIIFLHDLNRNEFINFGDFVSGKESFSNVNDGRVAFYDSSDQSVSVKDIFTSSTAEYFEISNSFDLPVKRIFLQTFLTSSKDTDTDDDEAIGHRIIIQFKDNTVECFKHEPRALWRRYDGLANVVDMVYSTVPMIGERGEEGGLGFMSFLKQGWNGVEQYLENMNPVSTEPTKYGFRKVLVLVTCSNSLFGFDTTLEEVIWEIPLIYSGKDYKGIDLMLVQDREDEKTFYALATIGDDKVKVSKIDGLNGFILSEEEIEVSFKIENVLEEEDKIHYFSSDRKDILTFDISSFSFNPTEPFPKFYEINEEESKVTGFEQDEKSSDYNLSWERKFNGKILATKRVEPKEPLSSYFYEFDEEFLKHRSPNLLAVAVESSERISLKKKKSKKSQRRKSRKKRGSENEEEEQEEEQEEESQTVSVLDLFVLEVLTGNVVFLTTVEEAGDEVSLFFEDNLLLMSYPMMKGDHSHHQLTVVEFMDFFEENARGDRGGSMKKKLGLESIKLAVESDSFYTQGKVEILASTRTKGGVSPPRYLARAGQRVYEIGRGLLNTRRSRPEGTPVPGVIPYHPTLYPSDILTLNETVHEIRGIVSVPTDLESVSEVLVFGTDLFFIRYCPSNTCFDTLPRDFKYIQLISVIVVIMFSTFALKFFVKRKEISRLWY